MYFCSAKWRKNGLCNFTFHDALLLGMGDILLELKENNTSFSEGIENFENAMKYTLNKTGELFNIKLTVNMTGQQKLSSR